MIYAASLSAYNLMDDGWKILNRKMDNYDNEWQVFKDLIGNYWYWFLVHIVCSEVFRMSKFKVSFINKLKVITKMKCYVFYYYFSVL